MKKIFTLLCALVITICASAQVEKQVLVSSPISELKSFNGKTMNLPICSQHPKNAVKARITGKQVFQSNILQKQSHRNVRKTATLDVTVVDFIFDTSSGDGFCMLTGADGWIYLFDLITTEYELNKTYTLDDMVNDYGYGAYCMDYEYNVETATDAQITFTKKDGLLHIDASMTLTSGDVINLTYQEQAFAPTGVTIDINASNLSVSDEYWYYYGLYEYTASTEDYIVLLDIWTDEPTGVFSPDDIDLIDSHITNKKAGTQCRLHSAETISVTEDDEAITLTGKVMGEDGNEYNLNLTYAKPDMLRATIFAENASLTNRTQGGGYFTIGATTADKTMSADFYIVSKGLQGTFTGDALFADYCDIKVNKESFNIDPAKSELKGAFNEAGDSLVFSGVVYGTSSQGQMGEFTIYLSTPFTQEWGEWADFAPFDKNTGKFTFSVCLDQPYTQADIPVQVRKDNTGLKQFKFVSWSKGIFTHEGIDLIVDMTPDNTCTVAKQNTGAYQTTYGEYLMVQDFASKTGQDVPSTYDPETGKFNLALSYFISLGAFGNGYETMTMDREILERDTVDVKSIGMILNDSYLSSNHAVIFSVQNVGDLSLFRVTSNNTTTIDGTFKWSDGTINDPNSYFVPAGTSQQVYFSDGEFTVESTATSVSLKGWMIGMDEKYYRLDWTYDPSKLQYDTPDKPINVEYSVTQSEASINVGKITISAFNGETELGLQLFTRMTNKSIPEGVFEISDDHASGTAQKSEGYTSEGITPCYAATLVERDGKLYYDEMWFMVEGTVTTSYDALGKLNVVVEGKNSYGQDIKAVITSNIDIKGEEDFKGQMLMSSDDYVEEYGEYQYIGAVDENNMINLLVYSKTETGSFNEASIDFFNSAIFVNGNQISLVTGEFTVAREGENLSLKGWVVANDHIKYNLDFDNSLLVGVESISAKKAQPATFYNIMGQKVSTLTNGQVYISEGKKFLKK